MAGIRSRSGSSGLCYLACGKGCLDIGMINKDCGIFSVACGIFLLD